LVPIERSEEVGASGAHFNPFWRLFHILTPKKHALVDSYISESNAVNVE
jgi:hypothetical protein